MRSLPSIVLGMVLLISIAGCSMVSDESGTPVSDEQLASFTKGKTTKADVSAALGDPQDIRFEADKQILVYRHQKVRMYSSGKRSEITFIFNKQGVLEDILQSHGSAMPGWHL